MAVADRHIGDGPGQRMSATFASLLVVDYFCGGFGETKALISSPTATPTPRGIWWHAPSSPAAEASRLIADTGKRHPGSVLERVAHDEVEIVITAENRTPSRLSAADGLISNITQYVAAGIDGTLWIATDSGISCYVPAGVRPR